MASTMRGAPLEDDNEEEYYQPRRKREATEEEMDEKIAEHNEMPPAWYLIAGWGFIVIGGFGNIAEVYTSGGGVVETALGVSSGNPLQILTTTVNEPNIMAEAWASFPMVFAMAAFLALVCQAFMHMYAQPLKSAWTKVRTLHEKKVLYRHVKDNWSLKATVCVIALATNILTDAIYANSMFHNWILATFWCFMLPAASTLMLYTGVVAVQNANDQAAIYQITMEAQLEALKSQVQGMYEEKYYGER